MLADKDFIRYSRQILLPECGEAGQLRLRDSHVAIVGVGGLGGQAAMLLAAAGVGHLSLFDGDSVELSNLPRQLLFCDADLGKSKAEGAAARLQSREPGLKVSVCGELNRETLTQLDNARLVLDCTDNFAARHLISAYCAKHGKTLISGAIAGFDGLLFVQRPGEGGCYQCLFPPGTTSAQNCASVGVMGPAVAIVASMQAQLCLNELLQFPCEAGCLQRFDFRHFRWHEARVPVDPFCPVCGKDKERKAC